MIWLNTNSEAIQAISTVAGFLFTILYVILTYKSISQIRKQNDLAILPIIIPEGFKISLPHKSTDACVDCNIKNIGNGPAKNVLVSFIDATTGQVISVSNHMIDIIKNKEDNTIHIHIPKKDLNRIRYVKKNDKFVAMINVYITFEDFSDKVYQSKKEFALTQKNLLMEPVLGTFILKTVK